MSPIRILLIDDHRVVRAGLRMLLEADPSMTIVGEGGNTEDALRLLAELQPDILLLDLSLGEDSGLHVLSSLPSVAAQTRVVVLTMHSDADHLRAALKEGAVGYVLKQSADTDLVSAIRRAAGGDVFVDGEMTRILVDDLVDANVRLSSADTACLGPDTEALLTTREFQVVRLIALGYTNKDIAQSLFLSVKTVETYRGRALAKLGLANRAELVRRAMREGWLMEESAP